MVLRAGHPAAASTTNQRGRTGQWQDPGDTRASRSHRPRAPAEGARNAMKTSGKVVTTIFALLAFAASFLVVTADLDVYQPVSKSSTTIHFVVQGSDSTRTIADRLQSLGLIRNAL